MFSSLIRPRTNPGVTGSPNLKRQNNSLEINCGNVLEQLNTFVQSCYPSNELKQQKLSFLVRFYLFKGKCEGMMSREPTRRIIKKPEGYEFYGGNFKLSFGEKAFVFIDNNTFDIIVNTTPFVSYTIFKKIEEELSKNPISGENEEVYIRKKALVVSILTKNMPGINTFSYLQNVGTTGGQTLLSVIKLAIYTIGLTGVIFYDIYKEHKDEINEVPINNRERVFNTVLQSKIVKNNPIITNRQKEAYAQYRSTMVRSNIRGKNLVNSKNMLLINTTEVYINLLLYLSYRRMFKDLFKIDDSEMETFINCYFSEEYINSIGKNAKYPGNNSINYNDYLSDRVYWILNFQKVASSISDLSILIKYDLKNIQQQGGKKQKKKRLVDYTVKELKEKMKKKGKKLSKDGVPLTKSQMIKSLKK